MMFRLAGGSVRRLSTGSEPLSLSPLTAISPVDGRYAAQCAPLRGYFSEFGLVKRRVVCELRWLQALAAHSGIKEIPALSSDAQRTVNDIIDGFSLSEAERVKEIEATTNHDMKSVEYYLKEKFASSTELQGVSEWLHFAATSEDINNLAYGLMFSEARRDVLLPSMESVTSTIESAATKYADAAMMARTHGQPATPTTMGKEMANFSYRLRRHQQSFEAVDINGKMNGAVGNFNAHVVAYPGVDWQQLSNDFVTSLGLVYNPYTTQIEPHDFIAELHHSACRYNNVLLDHSKDMWSYISLGYFKQRTVAAEVGSSTMPHKVNPIAFENSEGNLGLANAILEHLAGKLLQSRFQRDLSDSTALRSIGAGYAHSLLAWTSLLKGHQRVDINQELLLAELDTHWELLAEPIQTVMRKYETENPYEQLKALTRGADGITQATIAEFVSGLDIPNHEKEALLNLTPASYIGLASKQAREVAEAP